MHGICDEDVKNRGAGGNRWINGDDLFKRLFPAVMPADRQDILNTLTRMNLIERNGENIRLIKNGQDWCLDNNQPYKGSYPPKMD